MPTSILNQPPVNVEHSFTHMASLRGGGGWSRVIGGLGAPKPFGTVLVKDLVLINYWTLILVLSKLSILFSNSSTKNYTEDSNVSKHRDKQIQHFFNCWVLTICKPQELCLLFEQIH